MVLIVPRPVIATDVRFTLLCVIVQLRWQWNEKEEYNFIMGNTYEIINKMTLISILISSRRRSHSTFPFATRSVLILFDLFAAGEIAAALHCRTAVLSVRQQRPPTRFLSFPPRWWDGPLSSRDGTRGIPADITMRRDVSRISPFSARRTRGARIKNGRTAEKARKGKALLHRAAG